MATVSSLSSPVADKLFPCCTKPIEKLNLFKKTSKGNNKKVHSYIR